MQFTKATKKRAKARIALDGPSGSGKTFSALTAASVLAQGGKIAVIDTERGSASLYADKFEFDVLELDTFSPLTYIEAIQAAEQADYAVIVIDSLSHAWEGEGGALEMVDDAARRSKSNNTYFAWRDVTPVQRRMVDAMLQSPAHIIATMRSKTEYVIDTVNGKQTPRKVGMAPIQRAGMEYEFTIVGELDIDHNLMITKSRCELMADRVENKPSAKFWEPFAKWLNSGEAYVAPEPKGHTLDGQPEPYEPTADTQRPTFSRPYQPDELVKSLRNSAQQYAEKIGDTDAAADQRQWVAGALDKLMGEDADVDLRKQRRYRLTAHVFGFESTADMKAYHAKALLRWMGIPKGGYVAEDEYCAAEAAMLSMAIEPQPELEGAA
jgi:hypothetical protein